MYVIQYHVYTMSFNGKQKNQVESIEMRKLYCNEKVNKIRLQRINKIKLKGSK